MPCDNGTIDNLHTYIDILSQISAMCTKYNAEHVCIGGDMNVDLSRIRSQNTYALKQFIVDEQLHFVLGSQNSDVSHTYVSLSSNAHTTIDHFILSKYLCDNVHKYAVLDNIDNPSDGVLSLVGR